MSATSVVRPSETRSTAAGPSETLPSAAGATRSVEVRGAPFDQGVAQGLAFAAEIRAHVAELRRAAGRVAGREMRAAARRGLARMLRLHLTHQHERLEGIAAGADLARDDLALLAAVWRASGVGSLGGGQLECRLDPPPAMLATAILRRTVPDSVGFGSVELTCAPLAGCLAGVNEKGIAVATIDDRGPTDVPARALAQDLLYHAASLEGAIAHLRLRARYARGTGALLVADAEGRGIRADLRAGETRVSDLAVSASLPLEATARIDVAARQILFVSADGGEHAIAAC